MKKLASVLAAALTLAACAKQDDPAQQFRDAMPQKEAVQLGAPSVEGTAAPTGLVMADGGASPATTASPPYPPQSSFATISYWSAVGINGGTWWTLTLVKLVTSYPPTDCGDSACTWGPWLGDDHLNYWKLHVTKSNGAYDWAFSAQNAIAPGDWVELIAGHAVPGADANHGSGDFLIDFEAQAALAHGPGWVQRDFGTVEITYDNNDGTYVSALATGAKNADPADPHAMNAAYSFAKSGPGGQIQIAVHNLDTDEAVKLDTRWDSGGAGRGDALWSNDGGATWVPASPPPYLTQCWKGAADSWAMTFDDTVSFPTITTGTDSTDPAQCVFTVGEAPTIALP
jgi:hypothetical protein